MRQPGFSRLELHGQFYRINDLLERKDLPQIIDLLRLVIDRFPVQYTDELRNRLADSVQTAFYEGNNVCEVAVEREDGLDRRLFSKAFEADGISFEEPSEKLFSFNNPLGACPKCEGYGKVVGIDPDLVIPDKSLSIYDDAVVCWRGEVMSGFKRQLIYNADKFNFPIHTPYYKLTPEQQALVWSGNRYFEGLNQFFKSLEEQLYKIQYRVMLARFRGKTICPECHGTRLRHEAQWVKINSKPITDLVMMPVVDLQRYFVELPTHLTEHEGQIAQRLLQEINSR